MGEQASQTRWRLWAGEKGRPSIGQRGFGPETEDGGKLKVLSSQYRAPVKSHSYLLMGLERLAAFLKTPWRNQRTQSQRESKEMRGHLVPVEAKFSLSEVSAECKSRGDLGYTSSDASCLPHASRRNPEKVPPPSSAINRKTLVLPHRAPVRH